MAKGIPITASGLDREEFMKRYHFDPLKPSKPIQGGQNWKEMFGVPKIPKVKAPTDDKSNIASLTDMTIAHHTKLKPWQQNRKNQYDMMLQNDMMHPKDYEKHMKRHKIDPEHWLNFS